MSTSQQRMAAFRARHGKDYDVGYRRAVQRAAAWVRANHPDVWDEIVDTEVAPHRVRQDEAPT
jgi:hypothetical protein